MIFARGFESRFEPQQVFRRLPSALFERESQRGKSLHFVPRAHRLAEQNTVASERGTLSEPCRFARLCNAQIFFLRAGAKTRVNAFGERIDDYSVVEFPRFTSFFWIVRNERLKQFCDALKVSRLTVNDIFIEQNVDVRVRLVEVDSGCPTPMFDADFFRGAVQRAAQRVAYFRRAFAVIFAETVIVGQVLKRQNIVQHIILRERAAGDAQPFARLPKREVIGAVGEERTGAFAFASAV